MREVDQELFDAVKQGNLSKVQECLEKGTNVNAENNYGKTPLDVAREEGYGRIVNILGGAKKKGRLLETISDNPEPYLSGVTISNQPIRTRAPGN